MTGKETYSEEQYNQLLDSIFSRHRSVQDAGFAGDAYKPGLARMRAFDALLGSPSAAFRSVLVAGTNGKGSVSSLLAASLAATRAADAGCLTRAADAGCLCHSERAQRVEESPTLRVGLYTSPHLLDFRERIKILGAPEEPAALIPREAVYAFLQRWEADIDRLGLTFFEITTALAFHWFAEQEVDIAVVEVGLGGRLDSTNILTPALSVVTSIGLDHCALLGDTRAAIAAEKAGIFKPGIPALVGEYDAETAPVFVARASAVACPLHFVAPPSPAGASPSFVIPSERSERRNLAAVIPSERSERRNLAAPAAPADPELAALAAELDLRGAYQARNLATALAALRLLGVPPQPDALRRAAALTGLRGRWERLRTAPEVIADIGHNPPALRLNFAQLRAMMASGAYDRLIILYGIMADKALDDILPLFPGLDPADRFEVRYIFTTPSTARALPGEEILARFDRFLRSARNDRCSNGSGMTESDRCPSRSGMTNVSAEAVEPVADAVKAALAAATPRSLVYMGGSAFLVADVLRVANDLE